MRNTCEKKKSMAATDLQIGVNMIWNERNATLTWKRRFFFSQVLYDQRSDDQRLKTIISNENSYQILSDLDSLDICKKKKC